MTKLKYLRVFLIGILSSRLLFAGTAFAAPPLQGQYIEGEVLVLLKNDSSRKTLTSQSVESGAGRSYASNVAASVNAEVAQTYGALSAQSGKIYALIKSEGKTTEKLLDELKRNPNVISATPNYIVHAMEQAPNDPSYGSLWGLKKINAHQAWDKTTGSSQIYAAVLDTGIDSGHPDLSSNVDTNLAKDFTGSQYGFQDRNSHGTHVAGTIGAVGNNGVGVVGVNWTTKIFPLKVLGDSGSGNYGWIANAISQIIQHLTADPDMHIVSANLSLGGWRYEKPESLSASQDVLWSAFKDLSDMNKTLIVVAAGNDQREVGKPNPEEQKNSEGNVTIPLGYYVYPASYINVDNMIVVGAIDSSNAAASFTNWSETAVDLVAPGVGINSTVPQSYGSKSGTSMATPYVAGAVALLASHRPDLTASELKEFLLNTANSNVNPVLNNRFNTSNPQQKVSRHGLLDINAAIEAATIIPNVPVTGISISPSTPPRLYTNGAPAEKTVTLTATVSPSNATVQDVEWTTNAPVVATVSSSGSTAAIVTAVGSGDAQITAKARDGSNITESVTVQVSTYVTGITLNPVSVTMAPEETITLTPTITPSSALDRSITWSSSNPSKITVSNSTVTALTGSGEETATITAAANGSKTPGAVKATAAIIVKTPIKYVEGITITPSSLALTTGTTGQLSSQVTPSDATNKTVAWSSDKLSVATVDPSGLVTAVAAGTAKITAEAVDGSNVSKDAVVTVTNPIIPVTGISLSKYTLALETGTSEQLIATISPPNATNQGVLWSTADASVSTVDQGLVSAHGDGTTTITATAAGNPAKTASAAVTVTGSFIPVTALRFEPDTLSLSVPNSSQLAPIITPDNATDKTVSWQSSQPSVATVTQTGYVTAVSGGTTVITATAQGAAVGNEVKDTVTVTVTSAAPIIPVTDLSVAPLSLDMVVGEKKALNATVVPEEASNKEIHWISTATDVATLDDEGGIGTVAVTPKEQKTVTAVGAGSAIIRLTALGGNNVVAEVPVTVRNETPSARIPILPPGNVSIVFLDGTPTVSVGLPLTCSVGTSAPVQNAVLLVTYPDGSVYFVDMQVNERVLTFTFTPPTAGTYTLAFTLIEPDSKLSEPVLSLEAIGSASAGIDLSGLERIGLRNGVLNVPTGQSINVQLSTALGGKFSSTPLPANLVLTEDGHLSGTVVVPGTYAITIRVTTPTVYYETFTLVVEQSGSQTTDPPSLAPQNPGGGGGGCDAGWGGLVWAGLLTLVAWASRFNSRK
jgi:uncharacterized protein YjdB/subtilisin family serine protease